jgi:hypothetical protein
MLALTSSSKQRVGEILGILEGWMVGFVVNGDMLGDFVGTQNKKSFFYQTKMV